MTNRTMDRVRHHAVRKSFAVLAPVLLVTASPAVSRAASKPRTTAPSTPGVKLARHMLAALAAVGAVQVEGRLQTPGQPSTHLSFVFRRPDRERLIRTGGVLTSVKVNGRHLQSATEIAVGRAVYTSVDGKHWMHGRRATQPSSADALMLNGAGALCCSVLGSRQGTGVRLLGRRVIGGRAVYLLEFHTGTSTGTDLTTRVQVSTISYLPLAYTATTRGPSTTSIVTLRYRSVATIPVP